MAQADKFIDMLERGEAPPNQELDNHMIIAQKMNEFRLTEKYETMDPMHRKMFDAFLEVQVQWGMQMINPSVNVKKPHERLAKAGGPKSIHPPGQVPSMGPPPMPPQGGPR